MIESNLLQETQQKDNQTLLQEIKQLKTELAHTKHKLEDQKKIFHRILERNFTGYWDWHIKDGTEYLSPTFKSMLGYDDHELTNHLDSLQKIMHPDDLPKVSTALNNHIRSKGEIPYDNEVRYYHKDGSIVWVYRRGEVIEWDENDQPIRMVGINLNITELKNTQDKLSEYQSKLSRKNNELEQFAYIASHDLQEPLRTISCFVALLHEQYQGKLDDQADLYLKFITEASTRMGKLIQGLLDFSRLGRDKKSTSINCNELVKKIQEDLDNVITKSGARFDIGQLPEVYGFKKELYLLFHNLISNAIKFQAPNSIPFIRISAKAENGWTFAIQDNGIGIAEHHQDRIFTIFQRLHTRDKFGGTGIGLAHCKKIVELHGGNLWIESEPGQGSTFYFNLPMDN